MTSAFVFLISWVDHRLVWDPEDYGDISSLTIISDQIWLPDLVLLDRADGKLELLRDTVLTIRLGNDGRIRWEPGGTFQTMCKMSMRMFPFDKQSCELRLIAWATYVSEMHFTVVNNHSTALVYYTESNIWSLLPNDVDLHEEHHPARDDGEFFPVIVVTLGFKRKSLYFVVNIVCPCILFSLMLLTVFAQPPNSGDRVNLGTNVFLGLILFLLLVADSIPRSGDEVPILGIYLMLLLCLSSIAVVESILLGELAACVTTMPSCLLPVCPITNRHRHKRTRDSTKIQINGIPIAATDSDSDHKPEPVTYQHVCTDTSDLTPNTKTSRKTVCLRVVRIIDKFCLSIYIFLLLGVTVYLLLLYLT
ncbi:acetylcholine receptor subunit alpha-like 2 [Tubulanus polymorphus]|uniref:acetylcholine receptor subunit alpha-like 2 n=1 Tax=Tubulanus polymorphus TaxID=672921 RepID=UPI003DA2CC6C